MKNIIFYFSLIFVSTISLLGQENLSFSKVIQTDSVGKIVLFVNINDWFATTYNSANDVIQMADKDAGIIIGNGSFSYSFGKLAYLCYDGYVKYTIKVNIKDNRYKVELTNFNHSVKAGNNISCALGIITNSATYTDTGISKSYHNKVWEDLKLKVELYSNDIFKSLENKTKSIKTEKW
jgi:hypothetical protein